MNRPDYKVALLDVLPDRMFQLIESQAPAGCRLMRLKDRGEGAMIELAKEADFILGISSPISRQVIQAAPKLRFIQKWGAGYEKVDIQAAVERGIPVAATRTSNATTVAEHTILLILALLKKLLIADRSIREGRWIKMQLRTETTDLRGRVVGIVGLGNIGRSVVNHLQVFEVEAIYYDTFRLDPNKEEALKVRFVEFKELLTLADVISIHVPLTEETRGFFGRREFERMKRTAILINMARGPVIDEEALFEALSQGKIAGAGLDVFSREPPDPDSPLFKLDNVVLSPHVGGATYDSLLAVAQNVFRNIEAVANGQPVPKGDLVSL